MPLLLLLLDDNDEGVFHCARHFRFLRCHTTPSNLDKPPACRASASILRFRAARSSMAAALFPRTPAVIAESVAAAAAAAAVAGDGPIGAELPGGDVVAAAVLDASALLRAANDTLSAPTFPDEEKEEELISGPSG